MTAGSDPFTFAPLDAGNMAPTLAMVVAAMRDNPQHVAAFGTDPAVRQQKLQQMFGLMSGNPALLKHSIVVLRDGKVVGICGLLAPGECQPTTSQRLRMIPGVLRLGFGPARRAMSWLGAWAKHDPSEPHWHVGPVAVDPTLQGHGIGSIVMAEAMKTVDAANGVAYLETDKEINVSFYRKQGFEVIAEDRVLDTANWFMRRSARSQQAQTAA